MVEIGFHRIKYKLFNDNFYYWLLIFLKKNFQHSKGCTKNYKPKLSLIKSDAPASTKIAKFEAWPCSAATCKAVRPSPLGPIQESKSAPAWARILKHLDPALVAAACKGVRPQESFELRHLISSPLSRSSRSSALSQSAAWWRSLKKIK